MAWSDAARAAAAEARRRHMLGKQPHYTKEQKATIGYRVHGIPSTVKTQKQEIAAHNKRVRATTLSSGRLTIPKGVNIFDLVTHIGSKRIR